MKTRNEETQVSNGKRVARRAFVVGAACWAASAFAASDATTSEVRRGPFIVRADFDLTPLESSLAELDALRDDLTRTFRLPKARENVVVRVFRDEATWRDYQKRELASMSYRRALYDRKNYIFDRDGANGRVYLFVNPKFEYDLRHEGTHAFLSAAIGRSVPIWLDEGIAEYFEEPRATRLTNETWRGATVERLRNGEFSSLESLEKIADMSGMTRVKYGDSWAWVCWFLNGPESARRDSAIFERLGGAETLRGETEQTFGGVGERRGGRAVVAAVLRRLVNGVEKRTADRFRDENASKTEAFFYRTASIGDDAQTRALVARNEKSRERRSAARRFGFADENPGTRIRFATRRGRGRRDGFRRRAERVETENRRRRVGGRLRTLVVKRQRNKDLR